jgi:hypothetical protein
MKTKLTPLPERGHSCPQQVPNTMRLAPLPLQRFGGLVASALIVLLAGCATPERNPSAPRTEKGYADFYPDPAREIYWEIDLWDASTSQFKSFYTKFGAPKLGFLRLELPPGRDRCRITVLNLATKGPVEVEVEIVPEKITPVRLQYEAVGETYVRSVDDKVAHGGRRREVTDYQHQIYRLSAATQLPEAYQPKQKMPYAR